MFNDLSIIFQGPIIQIGKINYTLLALNSALINFPGAEIILSTWEGTEIQKEILDLNSIKIIYNVDPGSGIRKDKPLAYHNVNRIIKSSIEGLKNARGKYCIKTRSDMIFDSATCLHYFSRYNGRIENYSIFEDKIIVSNQTSINPNYGPRLLYHICDWFFLGRRDDLIDLYEIDFIDDNLQVRWYQFNKKPENSIDKNNLSLFMAEDFVISSYFKKYIKIEHDYYCDYSEDQKLLSEKLIASNFVIVDNQKLGIHSGKFNSLSRAYLWKCYTFQEWKKLYNIHVLKSHYTNFFNERLYILLLNLNPIHIYRILKYKYFAK